DRLHTFGGKGAFGGWLLRIAYTTFLQAKRRSSRYLEVLGAAREAPDSEAVSPAPLEEAGDLDKLLAVLNEEERAVMVMSYGFGMSHHEICTMSGLSIRPVILIILC